MIQYCSCLFTGCNLKADVVFVLDVSISIGSVNDLTVGDERFKVVTDFVSRLADFLTIGPDDSLIGVILFAQTAVLNFSVTAHTTARDVQNAINSIVYSEITNPDHRGTNTPDALRLLREAGRRGGALNLRRDNPGIGQIAFVITDGVANNKPLNGRGKKESAEDTIVEANALKAANIYDFIFAVGIGGKDGKRINENQLESIATDDLVFLLENFDEAEFERLRQRFIRVVCEGK